MHSLQEYQVISSSLYLPFSHKMRNKFPRKNIFVIHYLFYYIIDTEDRLFLTLSFTFNFIFTSYYIYFKYKIVDYILRK